MAKIKSDSEKRNIELQIESNDKFNRIWYSILFGEYQTARQLLKDNGIECIPTEKNPMEDLMSNLPDLDVIPALER